MILIFQFALFQGQISGTAFFHGNGRQHLMSASFQCRDKPSCGQQPKAHECNGKTWEIRLSCCGVQVGTIDVDNTSRNALGQTSKAAASAPGASAGRRHLAQVMLTKPDSSSRQHRSWSCLSSLFRPALELGMQACGHQVDCVCLCRLTLEQLLSSSCLHLQTVALKAPRARVQVISVLTSPMKRSTQLCVGLMYHLHHCGCICTGPSADWTL